MVSSGYESKSATNTIFPIEKLFKRNPLMGGCVNNSYSVSYRPGSGGPEQKNMLLLSSSLPNSSLRGLAFQNNSFTSLSLIVPIRLGWMCIILNRFFIQTSVIVTLVHVYSLLSALNVQQTHFFMFFTLQFKILKVWKL